MEEITLKPFEFLAGKWSGECAAKDHDNGLIFYDETVFEYHDALGVIFYLQKLWKYPNGVKSNIMHIESGYIVINSEGRCELINSHSCGKTERMQNIMLRAGSNKCLNFVSGLFDERPRVEKVSREFSVKDDILTYTLKIENEKTGEIYEHLVSTLRKAE